jgi:diguanylate cyclase (GGDEF)-like protein/PAS domain S-box-containing protein
VRIDQFASAEAYGRLGDALLLVSPDGTVLDASPAAALLYGHTQAELIGLPVAALSARPEPPEFAPLPMGHPSGAGAVESEHVRRDGSRFACEVRAIDVSDGDAAAVLCAVRDITDRLLAQDALLRSQERFENIAATIPGVLYEYEVYRNGGGSYTYVGPGVTELLGLSEQEMLATVDPLWKLVHPDDIDRVLAEDEAADGVGLTFSTDFRILTPDGGLKWIHMTSRQLPSRPGVPDVWCGLILDITQRKLAEQKLHQRDQDMARLNEELARVAASDSLTGLSSRRHFYDMLDRTIAVVARHGGTLSVASFDLDGLKRVNDSKGHGAGDQVLATFARLLDDLRRPEDVAGRLGGDEFSVILPGVDRAGAKEFAERVLTAVRGSRLLAEATVTASSGVSEWALRDLSDDLLRRADEALYCAKRGGRDAVGA